MTSIPNQGQGTTIAIVDAYSDPDITSDLALFSSDFGLPQLDGVGGDGTFQDFTPTGQPAPTPRLRASWDVEESLDVEYAHSIAPYANIDLVETADTTTAVTISSERRLMAPLSRTDSLTRRISRAWTSSAIAGAAASSTVKPTTTSNSISLRDTTRWPSRSRRVTAPRRAAIPPYSPNVVAVGGTSLYTASSRGVYGSETAWSKTTVRGVTSRAVVVASASTKRPRAIQSSNGVNYGARATPDVSMDANPNTGVLVIDSYDNAEIFSKLAVPALPPRCWPQ